MNGETNPNERLRNMLRQQLVGGGRTGDVGMKVIDPAPSESLDLEISQPVAGAEVEQTRLTFRIPGEHTTFSLGMASDFWRTDQGIFGRTDTHVLFETFTATRTFVSLGVPSTYGSVPGTLGLGPQLADGYAMVTEGHAWHEAAKQHYLLARAGDVVARARGGGEVLVQADSGDGTVATGGNLYVATKSQLNLMADAGVVLENPQYQENVAGEVSSTVDREAATKTHAIFDQVQSFVGIVRGVVGLKDVPHPGQVGFGTAMAKAIPPMLVDTAKLTACLAAPTDMANSATLLAKDAVTVSGSSASCWGTAGALLGSVVTADVVGGTASLKAATYGAVWAGVAVSVEGLTQVSVSAPLGEVAVEARKQVTVGSKKGDVLVSTEKGTAQLSGKSTYVHGSDGAQLTSGSGAGFGMFAAPDGARVGRITSGLSSFGSAKGFDQLGLVLTKDKLTLEVQSTKMEMEKSTIDLKTSSAVKLKAKTIEIAGKVLLG